MYGSTIRIKAIAFNY